MAGMLRLLKQKWYPPIPETASFTGRTVLITGATTGLGLEAAKKIACLAPETLIITARSMDKGNKAKDSIQHHVKEMASTVKIPEIHILLLNMNEFEPIVEFANKVTMEFASLDTVILNAGTSPKGWKESLNGWEEKLQVNALGTTLLALLLLPKLVANATDNSLVIPHMEIVTSGLARMESEASLAQYVKAEEPLSRLNDKTTVPDIDTISGGQKQYARSKMVMEINMKHIAALPLIASESGSPKVIVNSSCPGMCASDLGRDVIGTSIMLKLFVNVFFTIFARSSEQGSNTLVSALTRDVDGHGKMWKNDEYYDGGVFLESTEGTEFGDKIWHETCKSLLPFAPNLSSVLSGSK